MSFLGKALRDPEMAALRLASAASPVAGRLTRAAPPQPLRVPHAAPGEVARMVAAFDEEGSDKGSDHSYSGLYAAILAALPTGPRIVEVGLGSTDPDIPSSMGVDGVPGASLRAMRRMRPDASFVGADVDERALFAEPGIATHWVDQLRRSSLGALRAAVGGAGSCDLVIDDGLHTKRANLNTFRALFPALRPGGTYVIEDIDGSAIPLWRYLLRRRGLRHGIYDFRSRSRNDIDIAVVVRAA